MMVLWTVVEYLCSSQMILTHAVGGGLAYSLITKGSKPKALLPPVAVAELIGFGLWLWIPGGFATIATLALCLYWYEFVSGPQLSVEDSAVFMANEDISETVLKGTKLTKVNNGQTSTSKFKLKSDLKYIEYYNTRFCKCIKDSKGVIEVDDIAQISEGCYQTVEKYANRKGFKILNQILNQLNRRKPEEVKPERCFHLVLGPAEKTMSLIAPDQDKRDQWVSGLRTLFRRGIEARQKAWSEGIFDESDVDKDGMLSFDETVALLNSVSRSTNKAYVREIFNVFASISATTIRTSNGSSNTQGGMSVDQFQKFFEVAGKRPEINQVYNKLLNKNEIVLGLPALKAFLSNEQKETITDPVCHKWIEKAEVICPFYNMSAVGFTNFLLSEDQSIFNRNHKNIYQSMDHPLSHYYIATSHNTYLTKGQLKGNSSVDAYISAFKRGCKCVELDCWDGPGNEPVIYHGHTLTTKILFKDVIQAVHDYAFCVSDFPVILSFENHCTVEQQMVMAKHLSNILGDLMYTTPIPESMTTLPSPNELKRKIICKTKKLKESGDPSDEEDEDEESDSDMDYDIDEEVVNNNKTPSSPESTSSPTDEKSMKGALKTFWSNKKKSFSNKKEKAPKIAKELSDLVVFCQAVHFHTFEHSKTHHQFYEMSSFAEKKAMKLFREEPQGYITFNQRQFSRIYPAGARVDSSNYDPVPLWNIGSQLVALNYQTPSRAMQLNQALFANNGGCGYVLKPDCLRTENGTFNPRDSYYDNSGKRMKIKVISGSQLPYNKEATLRNERQLTVQIKISGIEADDTKNRTRIVKNNGYNPMWNDDLNFHVRVPELAFVTFSVKEGDNFLAGYILPFNSIMQGYRKVPLQTKSSEPLPNSSLFVHVTITDSQSKAS